jgi:N-acetylneuraminic acid mutarotase
MMFSIIGIAIIRRCFAVCLAGLLFAAAMPAHSQGSGSGAEGAPGQWTWMGGSGANAHPGIYGTLGTPAAGNIPGSRAFAASWIGADGNLWLFGGIGSDSQSTSGDLNDLWKYDISANQWTWMGGSSTANQAGVYGTLGAAAVKNIPGARDSAAFWTDSKGNFWLYGGEGYDANDSSSLLNDLWKYTPSTNEWAWMGGSSTANTCAANSICVWPPVDGTLGVAAAGNNPGSRQGASFWTDNDGNLWLFAGNWLPGSPENLSYFDDMWEFSPSTNEWTWMGGSSAVSEFGCEVDIGSASFNADNFPGCRYAATSWTDSSGNFWMFGGYSFAGPFSIYYNHLWEFKPSLNEWALVGGILNCTQGPSPDSPLVCDYTATYGNLGTPAPANYPGSRTQATSWTDNSGNLWLFGGQGYVTDGSSGNLNDLWEFNPASNLWAWMGGSSSVGQPGVYGTMGTPAAGNIPASSSGGASSWTDHNGNFWLFGLDFWKYQPGISPSVTVTPSSSAVSLTQELTVAVSVSGKAGTPTGTVVLTCGSYSSSVTTLSGGAASIVVPGGALPAGMVSLAVTYSPDAASSSVYINGGNSASVLVSGFTISGTPVTGITRGSTGNTSVITLTPAGGFTGSVTLTAAVTSSPAGAQDLPTLSFGSSSPASISGTAAVTAVLTISTTAPTTSALTRPKHSVDRWPAITSTVLACILLIGVPARRRRQAWLAMLLGMACLTCGVVSCGGGSGGGGGGGGIQTDPGTTVGSYTITVTGTSGTTSATGTVALTVSGLPLPTALPRAQAR